MTSTDSLLRPGPSQVLSSIRSERRQHGGWSPGRRVQTAFELSLEARRLQTASMKAQGFSEEEMKAALRTMRR